MKALKYFLASLGVCGLCIAFSSALPPDASAAQMSKTDASKLDCQWECDEVKKQCACTGKDCPVCAGSTKAYGGAPIVIGIQTCSTKCKWECTGSMDGQCVEWEKNCITVCRGR